MKKSWLFGFVLGFVLGTALAATAATCIGTGFLIGWTVKIDNEEVCSDPYIWAVTHEIECTP